MSNVILPLPLVLFVLGLGIILQAYYKDFIYRKLWPWESKTFAIGLSLIALGLYV